jgi:hypothetical protein
MELSKTEKEFANLCKQISLWQHLANSFEDMYNEAQADLLSALGIIKEITNETE